MCGIYGFIGKPTSKTASILRRLALLNEIRGTDSAGLALCDGVNVSLFKKPVASSKFMGKNTTKELIARYSHGQFLNTIGHTRMATRGVVNEDNAHPWQIGPWVFAHNGVINNFDTLQTKYNTDFQVDSQIIGGLLNLETQKTVYNNRLSGWYAVPHFNVESPRTLYMAVNGSPLTYYIPKNRSGLYFTSLKTHMQIVINDKGGTLATVISPHMYTFEYIGGVIESKRVKLLSSVPAAYQPKYTVYRYNPTIGYSPMGWWNDDYTDELDPKVERKPYTSLYKQATQKSSNKGYFPYRWDD